MRKIEFESARNYEDALARAAEACGLQHEYWDIFHKRHEVSSDVRRRILQVLGWNVSSFETVEQERIRRFHERSTAALPRTLVISQSDCAAPVTLEAGLEGSIHFKIALEDGLRLEGGADISALRRMCEVRAGGERWTTYELRLPAEVPLGYHTIDLTLNDRSIAHSNFVVCPDRVYCPQGLAKGGRAAGFNVALYGLRSERNWGCGDFTDLRELAEWAHNEIGFGFIGVNPLHALHNRVPYNASPYLPLSIFYKNLIYIDIERVPEFELSRYARQLFRSPRVQEKIRRLRDAEFVEYQEVDQLKRRFLKVLHREFRGGCASNAARAKAFADYCKREGDLLEKFASYSALNEILHKQNGNRWIWQDWPLEYQDPESEACKEFSRRHARTVEFYKYVQFVIEEQLSTAQHFAKQCGMCIGLYHDLALAADSCGSDLWAHRRFYVTGCGVGAPPDDFSPDGQNWAFPPPNARAHYEDGYRLYRASIHKIIRHGGALRIDHVMRLFRLFWIPDGVGAAHGTYVHEDASNLLRILALESVRNKSIVIGEDLGTVTDEIRDTLARFGILSYRLFYFEKNHGNQCFKRSHEYPREALVSSTTHDLPTIAGFWTFRDIEARRAAGLCDDAAYRRQIDDRKREKQRMLDTLHAEDLLPHYYERSAERIPEINADLHNAVVGFLAQALSMILLLNQEDFTKDMDQQNLPGSTAQYPNWQRKMKIKLEHLRSPEFAPYAAMFRHQLERTGRRCY
jgi:4-alpha-glucanotransferase